MNRFTAVTIVAIAMASPAGASSPSAEGRLAIVRPPSISLDSARVAESLRRASTLAAIGRMSDARREYRSLINSERAEGGYPAKPLWLLANAYYADDNFNDAARTLDKLADAAREVIDPATELRAQLEATVLWAKLKQYDRARAGLERVRILIKSPAISSADRSWALSRIGK